MAQHLAYTMAALCTVGGLMGYTKRNSRISLFSGTLLGTMYAYSGYLLSQNAAYGHELSLGTSALLTLGMGLRGLQSRKVMPIGLAILGLVNCVYHYQKIQDYAE